MANWLTLARNVVTRKSQPKQETRSGSFFEEFLEILQMHRQSRAGIAVGLDNALKISAVHAICRVLAEDIAGLPWKLQRVFEDGHRELAREDPLYRVLYRQTNDWQTSFEFREQLMYHAVLTGNAYGYINRDGLGRVQEIIPILPVRVRPRQRPDTTVYYQVNLHGGEVVELARGEILHIRGPSWDGVVGLDQVALAREACGLSIASEETQSDLHRNGLKSSGVIGVEGTLSKEARARIRERLKEFAAEDNQGVLILDQNAKFSSMQMSGIDSEHLNTRKYQIEELCRHFRVYPQVIMHTSDRATQSSSEQFALSHVTHSLMPWVNRWEMAADRDLIGPDGFGPDFDIIAKMYVQGLLRGDAAARASYYASGITNGWLTRADARDLEDFPAIEGLDKPLMPLNMGQVGKDGNVIPIPGGAPDSKPGAAPGEDKNPATKPTASMAELIANNLIEEFQAKGVDQIMVAIKIGDVIREVQSERMDAAQSSLASLLAKLEAASGPAAAA